MGLFLYKFPSQRVYGKEGGVRAYAHLPWNITSQVEVYFSEKPRQTQIMRQNWTRGDRLSELTVLNDLTELRSMPPDHQTIYDTKASDFDKIGCIKTLRLVNPGLSLAEAKETVEAFMNINAKIVFYTHKPLSW